MSARVRDDDFDPYRILGVAQGCSWDEVKSAYHARAKSYHPDRYANAELPSEVRDYLGIMARRINAAYKALETPHTVSRRAAASRSEAVYTSTRR